VLSLNVSDRGREKQVECIKGGLNWYKITIDAHVDKHAHYISLCRCRAHYSRIVECSFSVAGLLDSVVGLDADTDAVVCV
jgi:hypothetical protein